MSYELDDDHPAIVIDNGSSTCRAGFAGDDAPRSVFHSVVGRRKQQLGDEKTYIGDEAQSKRELLSLSYPMEHGIVTNWEDMEKIWNHAFFSDLKISPESHPILISEPPLNPKGNREKMAQVMFEGYRTSGFHVAFEAILALYSAGHYTGTMISVGNGVTHVVPIYEGYGLRQAVRRSDFGGRDLTHYLQHLLYKRGYSFTTSAELDVVREMKEQMCFVAKKKPQYEMPALKNSEESYKLPDGSFIKLGSERYLCPEALFQPDQAFSSNRGLTELVYDSLNACDVHTRKDLYAYMVLSGGSTFFPDFPERLQKELVSLTPKGLASVRTVAMPERKYHVWIGGSLMASLTSFQQMWVTRHEYEEYGPDILHRKCF